MVQAHRTYTNHTITEKARCVGCLCTSSGWFKHSEPTGNTPPQRLQRTYTLLTITELARCVGCFCTRAGWFKHSEPQRTYTMLTSTELARCVGCLCTRAGWFKHSGVVQAQRTSSNLHEPHHHRDSKVCRVLMHKFGWFKHSEPTRTTPSHL